MTGTLPAIDIVIVNWNTGPALRACVESVARAEGLGPARTIVVDNGSTDGSLETALAASPHAVTIRNGVNRGFAAACNQGAAGSSADYLLFLNPDTSVPPDTLSRAIGFMEAPAQADVGICGVRLVDREGQPSTMAARFPTLRVMAGEALGLSRILPWLFPRHLLAAAECASTRDVDQVIGAFFLIRRRLFEALGGFDERFFVYFEEVDLSYRARLAGQRSVLFTGAEALHHGGVSSDQVKAARLFYSLRSRLLYSDKHLSRAAAWCVRALTFGLERPVRTIRARALGGPAPAETAEAYRRLRAFVRNPEWRTAPDLQRRP